MSRKKKKSADEWVNFIREVFARKRSNRKNTIPKDYLMALADKIWRINPTKKIVYNTLADVYVTASNDSFQWYQNSQKFFKDKQNKHFEDDWNKFKDEIDDFIHAKSNVVK